SLWGSWDKWPRPGGIMKPVTVVQAASFSRVIGWPATVLLGLALLPSPVLDIRPAQGETKPQNTTSGVVLSYIPGSSAKLEQLLGETDKQLHKPTLSQTQ